MRGNKMKSFLIIGASKNDKRDLHRWNKFSDNNQAVWVGITDAGVYIERELKLKQKDIIEKSPAEILNLFIDTYLNEYDKLFKTIVNQFDAIMVDRSTIHGLIPSNPFGYDFGSKEQAEKFYTEKAKYFENNNMSKDCVNKGVFNLSILCVCFLKILSQLKKDGNLIFDTQYLSKDHIEILAKYFESVKKWDFDDYPELEYKEVYAGGYYGQHRYLEFKKFKGLQPNPEEIKQKLIQLAFSDKQAELKYSLTEDILNSINEEKSNSLKVIEQLSLVKQVKELILQPLQIEHDRLLVKNKDKPAENRSIRMKIFKETINEIKEISNQYTRDADNAYKQQLIASLEKMQKNPNVIKYKSGRKIARILLNAVLFIFTGIVPGIIKYAATGSLFVSTEGESKKKIDQVVSLAKKIH
jgi:hypothetical protein